MNAVAAIRTPIRSLLGIVFAAMLALSLVATTAEAIAASPIGGDRIAREGPPDFPEFFRGRGLLLLYGVTWE